MKRKAKQLNTKPCLICSSRSCAGTLNPNLPQLADFKSIPGPYHCCRTVLFDHRRTRGAEARFQGISVEDFSVHPSTCASEIDFAFVRRLRFCWRARQTGNVRLL